MNDLYTIRPLEWAKHPGTSDISTRHRASTFVGCWEYLHDQHEGWLWQNTTQGVPVHRATSEEDARRQCEEDYRARLLTMLEPVKQTP